MTTQQLKIALKQNKPIYLYGKSGTGKTTLLKELEQAVFVSIQEIQEFDDTTRRKVAERKRTVAGCSRQA